MGPNRRRAALQTPVRERETHPWCEQSGMRDDTSQLVTTRHTAHVTSAVNPGEHVTKHMMSVVMILLVEYVLMYSHIVSMTC